MEIIHKIMIAHHYFCTGHGKEPIALNGAAQVVLYSIMSIPYSISMLLLLSYMLMFPIFMPYVILAENTSFGALHILSLGSLIHVITITLMSCISAVMSRVKYDQTLIVAIAAIELPVIMLIFHRGI